jgi:hypothetical protein
MFIFLLLWCIAASLCLILIWFYADSARTAGFIEGYRTGQMDLENLRFGSYQAWWNYSENADQYQRLNQDLSRQFWEEKEAMIQEAEARSIVEGFGWRTGIGRNTDR